MKLERALVKKCRYLEKNWLVHIGRFPIIPIEVYRCQAANYKIVRGKYHCFAPSFRECSLFRDQVDQDWRDFIEADKG